MNNLNGGSAKVYRVLGKVNNCLGQIKEELRNNGRVGRGVVQAVDAVNYQAAVSSYQNVVMGVTKDARIKCTANLLPGVYVRRKVMGVDLRQLAANITKSGY